MFPFLPLLILLILQGGHSNESLALNSSASELVVSRLIAAERWHLLDILEQSKLVDKVKQDREAKNETRPSLGGSIRNTGLSASTKIEEGFFRSLRTRDGPNA